MRILIVGLTRGGTTYVEHLFQRYMRVADPNVFNEPFRNNRSKQELLQAVQDIQLHGVIVKDHVQHYELYGSITGEPFPFHIYDKFYKIKLLRSDFKGSIMSLAISRKWGKYNDFKNATILNEKLHITQDELSQAYASQYKNYKQMETFDKIEFNEVVDYEDLTGQPDKDKEKFKGMFRAIDKNYSGEYKDITIKKRKPYTFTIENLAEVEGWYEELCKKNSI